MFQMYSSERELGRGRKDGLRVVVMGAWTKAKTPASRNRGADLFPFFPMPPMPIVLRCTFLFLLTHAIIILERTKDMQSYGWINMSLKVSQEHRREETEGLQADKH